MGNTKEIGVKLTAEDGISGVITKVSKTFDTLNKSLLKTKTTAVGFGKNGKLTKTIMDGFDKKGDYVGTITETIDKTAKNPALVKKEKEMAAFNKELERLDNSQIAKKAKTEKEISKLINKESKNQLVAGIKKKEKEANASKKEAVNLDNLTARTEKYNEIGKKFNTNQAQTAKMLSAAGYRINDVGDVIDKAGKKQSNYNEHLNRNDALSQKFNMNALGVMFAGMAMQRTFANLNKTAREWTGMNEIMSTAMGVVMLPATMDLLEFGVLPLFDALTSLPEPAQKAIGYVSLALEGLGGVMMTGGQLMLGLESTSNLLAKFAGVKPELIFTSSGLTALKDKLGPVTSKLKTLGKLAVIGVTLSEVKDDIEEGEVTAAIGSALTGVGIMKGNKWMIGVGLVLKLTGDEDAQKGISKFIIWAADKIYALAEWIGDSLVKALSLNWEEIDTSFFSNFGQSFKEAGEELNASGQLSSNFLQTAFNGMSSSAEGYGEKLDDINYKYDEYTPEWSAAVDDLNSEYDYYIDYLDKANKKLQKHNDIWNNMSPQMKSNFGINTSSANLLYDRKDDGQGFSSIDGNYAVGGKVRKTGRYFLHEGEEVVPNTDVSEGINMNVTYNVTVSDKREFEQMFSKYVYNYFSRELQKYNASNCTNINTSKSRRWGKATNNC